MCIFSSIWPLHESLYIYIYLEKFRALFSKSMPLSPPTCISVWLRDRKGMPESCTFTICSPDWRLVLRNEHDRRSWWTKLSPVWHTHSLVYNCDGSLWPMVRSLITDVSYNRVYSISTFFASSGLLWMDDLRLQNYLVPSTKSSFKLYHRKQVATRRKHQVHAATLPWSWKKKGGNISNFSTKH
jgi:hypothetical protein